MSVTALVAGILPIGGSDDEDETDGLEALRKLLNEREAELSLTAIFGEPQPDMRDQPTVVFPYVTQRESGAIYREGAKEFALPDNGLQDEDSALVQFLASHHGIDPSDVEFEDLAAVEGTTATAEVNEHGDVEVGV